MDSSAHLRVAAITVSLLLLLTPAGSARMESGEGSPPQGSAQSPAAAAQGMVSTSGSGIPLYVADLEQYQLFTALLSTTLLFGLVFALLSIVIGIDDDALKRSVLSMNISLLRWPLPFGRALWIWVVLSSGALGLCFVAFFWPVRWSALRRLYSFTFELVIFGSLCIVMVLVPKLITYIHRRAVRLPEGRAGGN